MILAKAKVIERVDALYEVQDVLMGKVYRWCPENVLGECEECGENTILTASTRACGEYGADHRAIVEEVGLKAHPEVDEVDPSLAVHCALTTSRPGMLRGGKRRWLGACKEEDWCLMVVGASTRTYTEYQDRSTRRTDAGTGF